MTADEAYAEAVRRCEAARAEGAKALDLGDLGLERLPPELGRVTTLRHLALGQTKLVRETAGWQYEIDGIRPIGRFTDLGPVAGLTDLISLELRNCKVVTNLSPLTKLAALERLNLTGCDGVTDLRPLTGLAALKHLNLYHCKGVTDLKLLAGLATIQHLDLRHSPVTNLGPLAGLTALQHLDLRYSYGAVKDLGPLAGLTALQFLKLHDAWSVTSLGPLAGLSALQHLDLCDCGRVTDLGPLAGLAVLEHLDLRGCRVIALQPIFQLLDRLTYLGLSGGHFPDVPPELYRAGNRNVRDQVHGYFADLGPNPIEDPQWKLFLIGNGAAGKTKLAGRLRGQAFADIPEGSTHGVQLHAHDLPTAAGRPPAALSLWDFGGQDIYHGSHALFLRGPAVFVLVWSADTHNDRAFDDHGVPVRNRTLDYWFDYLLDVAGEDEGEDEDGKRVVRWPVLLVQTKTDQHGGQSPPLRPSADQFPYLKVLSVSAKTGDDLDVLEMQIRKAVGWLQDNHPRAKLGPTWVKARTELERLRDAGTRTLTAAEYEAVCETAGVRFPAVLRRFLHESSAVFSRPGLFEDRVILDQSWALEAVYAVFRRVEPFQRELRQRGGRFDRDMLARFFWGHYSEDEQKLFLGLMEQCHICFRVGERHSDEPVYAAPEFFPDWSADHARDYRQVLATPPAADTTLRYEFLHDGTVRRFLSELGDKLGNRGEYWRFGCHFWVGETEVHVECRPGSARDGKGAGTVRLRGWWPGAAEVVGRLAEAARRIPGGRPPQVEADTPAVVDQSEPLAPLADRARYRPQTVFLSYRHGGDSWLAAERLAAALKRAGWRVEWDEHLRNGEGISEFIAEVRDIPFFVPVLSARYYASRYCMSEFLTFWNSCRRDLAALRAGAVTVVLADAAVDDPGVCAGHADACRKAFDEWSPAAGGFKLAPEVYEEVQKLLTLLPEFGRLLYQLASNPKGPRGLDAATAGGCREIVGLLNAKLTNRYPAGR